MEIGKTAEVLKSFVKYDAPADDSNMARELEQSFRKYHNKTLLVDASSGRSYTGKELEQIVGRIATGLIKKLGVKPGDVVLMMCDRSDQEIIFALSAMFAGCAIYGSSSRDGYNEEAILCRIRRPDIIATNSRVHPVASKLRQNVEGLSNVNIIWIDNPLAVGERSEITNHGSGLETNCNGSAGIQTTPLVTNGNKLFEEDANNNQVDFNNNNDVSASLISESEMNHIEAARVKQLDRVVLMNELREIQFDAELIHKRIYEEIDPEKHYLTYMLTSGSTGRPKVVPSTHKELMHGMYSMLSATKNQFGSAASGADIPGRYTCPKSTGQTRVAYLLPLDENSVLSGDLPLDHGAGVNTMFLSLILGSKFVVMPSYDEVAFWQAVQDYRVSSSIASTTFTFKLLKCLKKRTIDRNRFDEWDLSCLKFIACVGSKLAFHDLIREINKTYDWIDVVQGYGCTEIGFISMLRVDDCRNHGFSVGHLFPGITMRIVPSGQEGPEASLSGPNENGDIYVWSRSRFLQYESLPDDDIQELNSQQSPTLFYYTGDLGHYDSEGRLYIKGRNKDTLFLDEDWKILPDELEALVDEHPLVEMSAIVGVPNPNLPGCHMPKAFVKLIQTDSENFEGKLDGHDHLRVALSKMDLRAIELDIYKFVADRTASPKHLKGGVRIVEEFPRNGILRKVDRKQLKQMS